MQNRHGKSLANRPGRLLWHLWLVLCLIGLPLTSPMAAMNMATPTQATHHHSGETMAHCAGHGSQPAAMSTDDAENPPPCHNQGAPCCTACAPYCQTSLLVPLQSLPKAVTRYQHVAVPLRVIALPRAIRPPIV